tara:strand:+ start:283 stop:507 length:225 start_codon:yes stop_codon:yes gene_type:complete
MEKMRELTKEEVLELDSVWLLIKTGRAPDKDAKAKAINLWNKIAGTNFKANSSCQSCLGTVFYGLGGLYNEYFK